MNRQGLVKPLPVCCRFAAQGGSGEIALGGQQGKQCFYERKAAAEIEALMVALSISAYSQWALWLLVQRAVEFDYINKISCETVRAGLKITKASLGSALRG